MYVCQMWVNIPYMEHMGIFAPPQQKRNDLQTSDPGGPCFGPVRFRNLPSLLNPSNPSPPTRGNLLSKDRTFDPQKTPNMLEPRWRNLPTGMSMEVSNCVISPLYKYRLFTSLK